ncbi:DUF4276 family protein [Synechococcus sp. PCC 7336]|uniref:DUF4276 family protein n=1 Tax=Synechococcus sp. PCC 7336 TaxID=195250 RepID=UPI00036CB4E1|nr:DUF4276 family protein [Synechococcus sp. PCC 7336]
MARLLVLVEGETEETFVNEVLADYLYSKGFFSVKAKLMGNARNRNRRGGIRGWPQVCEEIIRHLKEDTGVYVSTMVDYYALPEEGKSGNGWPGRSQASSLKYLSKARHIEIQLINNIANKLKNSSSVRRFIPYIMMHEFEGLLFSDCQKFAIGICREDLFANFQQIRNGYSTPEEINDSPETHPSKRITDLMPEYQKPIHGNFAAIEIGLTTFMKECPGFYHWIERIESII